MDENEIAGEVVDAAVNVHRELGPGLLESVYELILARQLEVRGLQIERQILVPIRYKGIALNEGFRADIIVNRKVVLELKSIEALARIHHKQLLTYLKLSGLKLGFLFELRRIDNERGFVADRERQHRRPSSLTSPFPLRGLRVLRVRTSLNGIVFSGSHRAHEAHREDVREMFLEYFLFIIDPLRPPQFDIRMCPYPNKNSAAVYWKRFIR